MSVCIYMYVWRNRTRSTVESVAFMAVLDDSRQLSLSDR